MQEKKIVSFERVCVHRMIVHVLCLAVTIEYIYIYSDAVGDASINVKSDKPSIN